MSKQTIAARDLLPGDVVRRPLPGAVTTPAEVTSVGRKDGMIAVTYDHSSVPLLYDPDARLTVVSKPAPSAPAPPADPRDEVVTAARRLIESWHVNYPAGADPEAVIGLREGELDAAVARLDALVADRVDTPQRSATSCPSGVACTGRDGQPSPHACPVCGHCADHAGGCAARTDTGRCGCTGGGADHPHADPGDGRTECQTCGKWVWPGIHSCKGVPVTAAARERRTGGPR